MFEVDLLGSSVAVAVSKRRRLLIGAASVVTVLTSASARAEPPADPEPQVSVPRAAEPTASVPLLAYVVGALGLSGLSVGATTGFLAFNQKSIAEDHCSPTLRLCDATGRAANNTGHVLRDISTAGFIVGGLGVGLSAYLLLTAPTRRGDLAVSVLVDGASPRAALVAHF